MWRSLSFIFTFCFLFSMTVYAEGDGMSFDAFQAVVDGDDIVTDTFVEAETRDGTRYVKLLCDVAWVDTDATKSISIGSDDGTPRVVELDLNGHGINANRAGTVRKPVRGRHVQVRLRAHADHVLHGARQLGVELLGPL